MELSQQQVWVKSKILTLEKMMHVDKEAKKRRDKIEKDNATIERNILPRVKGCVENLSSSSMSMYSLDSSEEKSKFLSRQTPTIFIHHTPLLMNE